MVLTCSQGKESMPSPGQFMIFCWVSVADGNKIPHCLAKSQPTVHKGHIPGKTRCQEKFNNLLKRTVFDTSAVQSLNSVFRAISLNPRD